METTKKVANCGITLMSLLFLISQQSIAQNAQANDLFRSKNDVIGYVIVGSILGLGILLYLIVNVIAKQSEKEESANNIRSINPRPHHHHRVIKKSA